MTGPTRSHLHEVISDAIWMAMYSGALESPCELADIALELLGMTPTKDGVGPWPDHHHSWDGL